MANPMSSTASKTILFVDDEASILSALRRLFRPLGYRILTAGSGAAGLEVLAEEQVDMVISDIHMPEMDGTAFLEKVHADWPHVIRILLTGYADINPATDIGSKSKIFCYISKPWNNDEIVQTVHDAFERQSLQGKKAGAGRFSPKPVSPEQTQKLLSLAIVPISLLFSWLSVTFLGWPSIRSVGENGIGGLLLYIFAIWSVLQLLLFGISAAMRKTE